MLLREFIVTQLRQLNEEQSSKEDGEVRLYHKVGHGYLDFDIIKSVIIKGLIPNNNGERGSVIWFADNLNDYAKNNAFILYYDLNLNENGITKNKYGIIYDGQNAYAHERIPFNDLNVLRIPIGERNGKFITNEDFLKNNIFKLTPERTEGFTIYVDLFNMYVQPYIESKNYIDEFSKKNDLQFLF
jgi:hypothetical protein